MRTDLFILPESVAKGFSTEKATLGNAAKCIIASNSLFLILLKIMSLEKSSLHKL